MGECLVRFLVTFETSPFRSLKDVVVTEMPGQERPSLLRVILAFLISPAVPTLLILALQGLIRETLDPVSLTLSLALYGYLSALVLGVPAYIALRSYGQVTLAGYVSVGTLIGLVGYALVLLPDAISTGAIEHWRSVLQLVKFNIGSALLAPCFGFLAGAVFWSIAVRRSE